MYIQWWNVVTLDYAGLDINPRYDMFIRRGRLGTSGRIHPKVFFNASFAYDGVGKDSLSAAAGVPNAEDNSTFFPRDIFVTYELHRLLNITTGYFRPRAGKESIYSSSFNISQEKSWASFQPRIHMVGRGIGRETGINVGGLLQRKKISILYDVGVFDTNHPLIVGNNTIWSPLFTGRAVFMFGQPEMTQYTLTYFQSGYGLRKGISFGVNGTYQKETERFYDNSVMGVDMQLNYGPFDFLAEYDWLYRKNRSDPTSDQFLVSTDRMLTLKAGFNVLRDNGRIWQVVAMFSNEIVDDVFAQQEFNPFTLAQNQYLWEAGVNYLIMRINLNSVCTILKEIVISLAL